MQRIEALMSSQISGFHRQRHSQRFAYRRRHLCLSHGHRAAPTVLQFHGPAKPLTAQKLVSPSVSMMDFLTAYLSDIVANSDSAATKVCFLLTLLTKLQEKCFRFEFFDTFFVPSIAKCELNKHLHGTSLRFVFIPDSFDTIVISVIYSDKTNVVKELLKKREKGKENMYFSFFHGALF